MRPPALTSRRIGGRDVRTLVQRLAAAAPRFGSRDAPEKLRLLRQLAVRPIREPATLLRLHEALCFLQAYPDDGQLLAAVNHALDEFPARVGQLDRSAVHQLHDSGIAGTLLRYPFGFPMARWLARRFPGQVDVTWERFAKREQLREVAGLLVHPMEEESFSEFGLEWKHWLRLAKSGRRQTDLQFLVELFERAALPPDVRDTLFEGLALPIRWTLHGPGGSRTLTRLPASRPFFRRGRPLRAWTARSPDDVAQEIRRPLSSLRRAPRALATVIIDAARCGAAVRLRELYGISYANPDDVLVADAGQGLQIALIGVLPNHRLPLESFFGYLVLHNGVPVGYGGAWQLFETLEFGTYIFKTFRQGESTFITTQVLRVFHHALRMRAVVLQPFQIGHGNPEALESGAFHFYYRIGFRPYDPRLSRLAGQERARVLENASYRTPRATLRRLAEAEMFLAVTVGHPPPGRRLRARQLAALVTEHLALNFDGDRNAASRWASARVVRALGVTGHSRWPAGQRRSFDQLSLLVGLIPDLEEWGTSDKSRLVRVLRAKGGRRQLSYVRLLDGHRRLRESLAALVAGCPAASTDPAGDGARREKTDR